MDPETMGIKSEVVILIEFFDREMINNVFECERYVFGFPWVL
jgi:hypothetical protein